MPRTARKGGKGTPALPAHVVPAGGEGGGYVCTWHLNLWPCPYCVEVGDSGTYVPESALTTAAEVLRRRAAS